MRVSIADGPSVPEFGVNQTALLRPAEEVADALRVSQTSMITAKCSETLASGPSNLDSDIF